MNYRYLGHHGIRLSEVGLGGWLTQGRSIDQEATNKIVRRAFDLGINFFDTADAYNAGKAEEALAVAVEGIAREELVLATKCFFPITDSPNDRGLSRKHIVESVNKSLKRLNTDYIDLFQFHRFDGNTPLEETVLAIHDLVRQGKVLYWGVSEWSAAQIEAACALSDRYLGTRPASNQPQYHMLNPWIEKEVIPASERLGLGQVVFSPLAQGVLTGKYKPGAPIPDGSRASDDSSNMFMGHLLTDEILERVQKLNSVAEAHGVSLPVLALRWCLRQTNVTSVIVGASRVEQIEQNAQAGASELDPSVWQQVHAILNPEEE